MSLLIQLFLEFFKIGLFAVGGGLATIPFLHQLAEKYTWFTVETLVDMIAISESTPGAMGVNMATYTGFTLSLIHICNARRRSSWPCRRCRSSGSSPWFSFSF